MNSVSEPVINQSRHLVDVASAKELLDALSSGGCDQDYFFRALGDTLRRAPDTGWELLALADQYYRRGKITAETFGSIKAHLQDLLMGKSRGETSMPLARNPNGSPATPAIPMTVALSSEPTADAGATRTLSTPAARSSAFSVSQQPRVAPMPNFSLASRSVAPAAGPGPVSKPLGSAPAGMAASSSMPAAGEPAALCRPGAARSPRSSAARPSAFPITGPAWATADSTFVTRPASIPLGAQGSLEESPDAPPYASDWAPTEGDLLRGRYQVKGLLGQGGMGTVFEAIDQFRVDRSSGDQRVAIKVLHTAIVQRPRLFAELQREFQYLQSLSHPNIVRVHEFDRDGDLAFFTMEYLSGALLSRIISNSESPLFRPYALAIIRDVGSAVVHAHSRGVVHGDLNPGNIFVTDNGEVRVLDFGASHQLHHGPWISEFDTLQHVPVATPSYASCQLLSGEAADARDDVYALACVAYVLMTGNHPFDDQTALRARTQHLSPRRPSGLTGRQWRALQSGLRFDREQRPSDVRAWLERLDLKGAAVHLPVLPTLFHDRRRSRGGREWAVAAAVALICIAAGGWWATRHADSLTRAGDAAIAKWNSVQVNAGPRDRGPEVSGDPPGVARAGEAVPPPEPESLPPRRLDQESSGAPNAAGTSAAPSSASALGPPSTDSTRGASNASRAPGASNAGRAGLGNEKPTPGASAADRVSGSGTTGERTVGAAAAAPVTTATGPSGVPFRARIELTSDTVEVTPDDSAARITVKRTRAMHGDADFSWWTESGTAKPGRDFVPVKSQVETIPSGKNSASLIVPLVVDPARHDSRSFYVVIDAASDDAAVGPRTLTMVTIPGSD